MKSLRISILTHDIGGGTFTNLCVALIRGFQELGAECQLVVLNTSEEELARYPDLTIVSLGVKRTSLSLLPTVRYMKEYQPDILFPMPWYFNVVAVIARFLANVPTKVILGEHNIISMEAGIEHFDKPHLRFLPVLMRYIYPHGDGIIGVSRDTLTDLVDTLHIPDVIPMRVILNPISRERVERLAKEPIDHPWFQTQGVPKIVTAARLAKQKQLDGLLRAFAQVVQVMPAKLIILGDGPLRDKLTALSQELGITDSVWMPGYDSNPYRYMAASDAFVLASAWEGCPIALQEAMACGAPVVVTDAPGGMKDIIEYGKHGLLVPTGNPEALAQGLLNILTNSELGQHYRQASLARSRDFHYLNTSRQYLEFGKFLLDSSSQSKDSLA
ncbi:glycosyltransferase [Nodosilinea sp. LEGE 07088]|uniref:glycosyltransferase n=1 Tax=Nodosilinea sp. LEGE 07088 TaxID=2777968 RepID=UPI00187EC92C|nr:glycosyltransferase [Nodosilinea sp. LEGE 07088]MBE9140097.1 glycosyltransferase [Nodosilinea sp. LEGE 07088]